MTKDTKKKTEDPERSKVAKIISDLREENTIYKLRIAKLIKFLEEISEDIHLDPSRHFATASQSMAEKIKRISDDLDFDIWENI